MCERGITYMVESIVEQLEGLEPGGDGQFSIIYDLTGFTVSAHSDKNLMRRVCTVPGFGDLFFFTGKCLSDHVTPSV
jgi:hypothetical protein